MEMLPFEKQPVFGNDSIDEVRSEVLADGSPVLVVDNTGWLEQDPPPASPRLESKICVFQIKRSVDMIKATQLQKHLPVERGGATSWVEARLQEVGDIVYVMP